MFALGEGQSSVIQRDGKTLGSYEQRYAIFPEQSGTLILPSDSVTASVRVADGIAIARKTVRVGTQEQRITVRPIPAEYPSDQPWLPAIAVTATVDFEPSPAQTVNVGDTIARVLTVTVIGNTGTSVPPTTLTPNEREFRIYQQPTNIENETFGENLVGYRVETVNLVPIMPGALGVPGTTITWWNTDTESVMTTDIQRRALSVTARALLIRSQHRHQPPTSSRRHATTGRHCPEQCKQPQHRGRSVCLGAFGRFHLYQTKRQAHPVGDQTCPTYRRRTTSALSAALNSKHCNGGTADTAL